MRSRRSASTAGLLGFVRLALRLARGARMRWDAACTAQERVGAFFERHGSERTPPDELPTRRAPGQLAAHRDI